ncbi:hypothetical protein [Spirosoma koreense]
MRLTPKETANGVLFLLYALAIGWVLWEHEMWRDELQSWGIAVSADTPADLIQNARYEGHPLLWFVLLWPITKLWSNPVAMQIFHGCLALASAYLILFRSPFTTLEKALILFSYYFIYEYAAISRNYQIGVLLICSICVLWKNPAQNLLKISLLLFLLFQTNVFAFLVGLALAIGLLAEEFYARRLWPLRPTQFLAALIIVGGMFLTTRSVPPADSSFLNEWSAGFNRGTLFFALAGIAHGFLPITDFSVHQFWNYSFVPFGLAVKLTLGGILLLLAIVSMPRERVALLVLGTALLFLFVFTYEKPRGLLRHFGHYTLALVAAYWIQGVKRPAHEFHRLSLGYFGVLILLIQVLAGLNAWYRDVRYPFSRARDVAAHLRQHYPKMAVSGVFQDNLTAVRWYLQKPIYYLDVGAYRPFVLFNQHDWNDRMNSQPDSVIYGKYLRFQQVHPPSLLVMAYHSPHSTVEGRTDTLHTRQGDYHFTCIKTFDGSITDENYYLFSVKKAD